MAEDWQGEELIMAAPPFKDAAEEQAELKAMFEDFEKGYIPAITDDDVIREAYRALPVLLTYEEAEAAARARKGL